VADLQTLFERGSDEFVTVVGAIPDDSWSTPTPCDLSVRELVGHVLAGNEFAVRLLADASAADAVAGIDEIRLGPDPVERVVTSCAKQSDAFGNATADRPLHHPSGDIDLETFVRFRLAELVIHAWDIATEPAAS
jgi:uncharacterized protein (TIGR03086 family)